MSFRARISPAVLIACVVAIATLVASVASGVTVADAKSKSDAKADAKQFKQLLSIASPKLAVASAKNAGHAKNADTAKNALKLGGLAPSAFQLRVSGSCTGSNAIQSIANDGSVSCQPTGTGTVTGVSADTGLTGGGNSGNVSLALDPNYALPQGCTNNQLAKWTGSAWGCTDAPGGPPTGAASGDLTGSYPNPSIADGTVTDAKVASANKDGAANAPSLRTLGTGAQQAAAGNDSRLSDSRTPSGAASGALSGNYPGPTLNVSGGPCLIGQFVTDLSSAAALTCGPVGNNSALGQGALFHKTTGAHNSALGYGALNGTTTGSQNSALGSGALTSNTTASNNTAVGDSALANQAGTTGGPNTAVGQSALGADTTGGNNTALGYKALSSNTTAGSNAAVGKGALQSNAGGSNAALGDSALNANTSGTNNTGLGQGAGQNLTTGNNNIDINNAGVAGESATTRIGTQGTQNKAFLAGVSGVTPSGTTSPVVIDGTGQLGTTANPKVYERFRSSDKSLTGDSNYHAVVGPFTPENGTYVVTASWTAADITDSSPVVVICQLKGGGGSDLGAGYVSSSYSDQSASAALTFTESGSDAIELQCASPTGSTVVIANARVYASQIKSLDSSSSNP